MAKAVALTQGWHYGHHDVMNRVRRLTGSDRVRHLQGTATVLHRNFYALDAEAIGMDLDDIGELLDILDDCRQ